MPVCSHNVVTLQQIALYSCQMAAVSAVVLKQPEGIGGYTSENIWWWFTKKYFHFIPLCDKTEGIGRFLKNPPIPYIQLIYHHKPFTKSLATVQYRRSG